MGTGGSRVTVDRRLDDAGLTERQFRVYCHLVYRVETGGFPSLQEIGEACFGLTGAAAKRAAIREVNGLVDRGALSLLKRQGPHTSQAFVLHRQPWNTKGEHRMDDLERTSKEDLLAHITEELEFAPLSARQYRVYGHLARRANGSGESFPSLVEIGRTCWADKAEEGASDRALVVRAWKTIKQLAGYGMITIEHRFDGGKQTSNLYRLTRPAAWRFPGGLGERWNDRNERKAAGAAGKPHGSHEEPVTASSTSTPAPVSPDALPVSPEPQAPGLFDELIEQEKLGGITKASQYTEAVQVYRTTTGVKPNREQAALINDKVVDLTRWRQVLKVWLQRGYNPHNVANIVSFYENGDKQEAKAPAAQTTKDPNSIFAGWFKKGK